MKFAKSIVAALAIAAFAVPALAQETALPPNTFIEAQPDDHYLARDVLIGAKVQNSEGKIIGDIEDIILNDWNRVQGVIIGTGGFLGVGEKRVGVALSALEFKDVDGKRTVVMPGVTKEKLQAAKAFERKEAQKSLLQRAMDKARELTDKTTESTKEAYEKAKEQSGPAYEKAKEAASKAYEATKDAATKAYDATKDAAAKAYDKAKEAAQPAPKPAQ